MIGKNAGKATIHQSDDKGLEGITEKQKNAPSLFFYASSGRMSYEIHVNGIISEEPMPKKITRISIKSPAIVRIRGLIFGTDGKLRRAKELGYFEYSEDKRDLFLLAGEKRTRSVTREEFYSSTDVTY